MRIQEIETYRAHSNSIAFAGTLRNAINFELFENVFILSDGKMVQCKVVGKELPPSDNPDYIYKIELPEGFIDEKNRRVSRKCDAIFKTIEDAKKSALKELEQKYILNKGNIERFFKQF